MFKYVTCITIYSTPRTYMLKYLFDLHQTFFFFQRSFLPIYNKINVKLQ